MEINGLDVVVLENEKEQFERLVPAYTEIFERLGYHASFDLCEKRGDLSQILKRHPHVVICDLSLGDDAMYEYAGLEVIANYQNRYPDILFVGNTRVAIQTDQFGAKFPNPDIFISKFYLFTDPKYREYLTNVFQRIIRKNGLQCIEFQGDFENCFRNCSTPRPKQAEIRSLIQQVTFLGHGPDLAGWIHRANVKPIPGGYSGAAVFEIELWAEDKKLAVKGVLKISKIDQAEDEYYNYNRYVKWYLPYLWRVDVLGTGRGGNFGAVCYSFVHTQGGNPRMLSKYLEDGNLDAASSVIDTIFSPETKMWYKHVRVASDKDLSVFFSKAPYFRKGTQIEDCSRKLVRDVRDLCREGGLRFESDDNNLSVDGSSFPVPHKLLFTNEWGSFSECICHGDLNSNNIMSEENLESLVFIDFQRTGFAQVFWDFIVFESSVRLYLPQERKKGRPNLRTYIAAESKLLDGQWNPTGVNRQYLRTIGQVRMAAHLNFPDEPYLNYVFGCVVQHWRLGSLQKLTEEQKLRFTGMVLAGLSWLVNERGKSKDGR